jgi:hypothetical protein
MVMSAGVLNKCDTMGHMLRIYATRMTITQQWFSPGPSTATTRSAFGKLIMIIISMNWLGMWQGQVR